MHFAATATSKISGGFLHVPAWRTDSPAPALTLDDIVRGITIALEVSAGK